MPCNEPAPLIEPNDSSDAGIYDVAVIGGGRAGAAAARVLAAGGCRTLLMNRPGPRRIGESLIPDARTLLQQLGVWDRFREDGHLPCWGNQSVWGSGEVAANDFIRSPYGHGWHLDGARLDGCLGSAVEAAGATVWPNTALRSLRRRNGGQWALSLTVADGEQAQARFVIDATGRSHRVARRLGVHRRHADRLIAFQARFRAHPRAPADEDASSFVEAAADGWWYTARMPSSEGRERAVTLFTDADSANVRQLSQSEGFLAQLAGAPAVTAKLTDYSYTLSHGPIIADARSSRLERLFGDGWLAIGDAAMAFDPLSSQGIYTALYAGVRGARSLLAHLGGDARALPSLSDELLGIYHAFRDRQQQIYRLERRWPRRRFWRVRSRPRDADRSRQAGQYV